MPETNASSYEELRKKCIATFAQLYKDSLVFDACKVDKTVRIRLQGDPVYVRETKAIKARLFSDQLDILDNVISGMYSGDKAGDQSSVVLKAMEMKTKLLLDDLDVNRDDSAALNVTFVGMTKEDFSSCPTVEVVEGASDAKLGADFGDTGDNDSFEGRMKADIKKRMEEAAQ